MSALARLVGDTPVSWIGEPFAPAGRGFWAKLEGVNPGGLKDRPALYIVERARARGELSPGEMIVESTSGTFGLGLALAGIVYNHPVTVVTDQGMETMVHRLLTSCGARVETVEHPHPAGGWQQARLDRVAELLALHPGSSRGAGSSTVAARAMGLRSAPLSSILMQSFALSTAWASISRARCKTARPAPFVLVGVLVWCLSVGDRLGGCVPSGRTPACLANVLTCPRDMTGQRRHPVIWNLRFSLCCRGLAGPRHTEGADGNFSAPLQVCVKPSDPPEGERHAKQTA
ncbi:pyridoxal-phosphate dependent enzyme [Nonomuraea sp. NPDC046802]|uniref:pyridoxal-phosphate dependent enzyme n=1 Tax=Nonomuraea sp. NPDC046802 TaxID=3154919 RepID=UPI0033BFC02C